MRMTAIGSRIKNMMDVKVAALVAVVLISLTSSTLGIGMSPLEFRRRLVKSVYGNPEKSDSISTRSGFKTPNEVNWDTSGKFEGDILLSPRQVEILADDFASEGAGFRNVVVDLTKRWPDGIVIYAIAPNVFSRSQIYAMFSAMEEIERLSCIKFKPRQNENHYVLITGMERLGCISQVGFQRDSGQLLNLARSNVGKGCFSHGTIVHELLHSLGMMHMQNTADRDKYVHIDWSHIKRGSEQNFVRNPVVLTFGLPYDFASVMHYPDNAFSINKPSLKTVIPLKRQGQTAEIGQRHGMSSLDTIKLNRMYNCPARKGGRSPY